MNGSTNESTDGRYQARHTAAHDGTMLRLAPGVSDGSAPPAANAALDAQTVIAATTATRKLRRPRILFLPTRSTA